MNKQSLVTTSRKLACDLRKGEIIVYQGKLEIVRKVSPIVGGSGAFQLARKSKGWHWRGYECGEVVTVAKVIK